MPAFGSRTPGYFEFAFVRVFMCMTGRIFSAWSAAELPVAEASDYEASAAAALADTVEVIAEKAGEVVTSVTQPNVAVPLIAGTATSAVE
jgi:hypothetical protein